MAKGILTREGLVQRSDVVSGSDFGPQLTSGFTRISGTASVIGSMTIRLQGRFIPTGPVFVSSNWAVNSGVSFLDVPCRTPYTAFDVTNASSQLASLLFTGEVLR